MVLTWTQEGHSPTYYKVLRGGNILAQVDGAVRTYTDSTVLEGATYVYKLRGVMQANQERGGNVIYSTVLSSPITVTVLSVPSQSPPRFDRNRRQRAGRAELDGSLRTPPPTSGSVPRGQVPSAPLPRPARI